jgi:peptide/nickel transport system permease protein
VTIRSLGQVRAGRGITWLTRTCLSDPVARMAARRLLMGIPLIFLVSVLSFVLVSLTPGDAARDILGSQATEESYRQLREALGLNLPVYEQYWNWVRAALSGGLGTSLFSGVPVIESITSRLPVTVSLMLGALLVSLLVGVSLGVLSAAKGGAVGRVVDAFALVGFSLPSFWVGGLLIVAFAVQLQWLPATGYVPLEVSPGEWLRALVLPVLALSLGGIASVAKQTREAMLDALSSEYVRMARANGVSWASLLLRHALKNASIRVVTVLGVQAVNLLGGAVVIESVFALPGIGSLAVQATARHDLPVIQGIVVYVTVLVVFINLLVDVAYSWLNPKVKVR